MHKLHLTSHILIERSSELKQEGRAGRTSPLYWLILCLGLSIFYSRPVFSKSSTETISLNIKQRCGEDHFEPNDYRSRARNLSSELKHTREISARVCAGDQDWYTVWINRGELVEFVISAPLEAPPLLKVYAPRKRKPSGILRTSAPSMRRLRLYAKKSGRYRIQVMPKRAASSSYILSLHRPSH